jgi:hypothetical protein
MVAQTGTEINHVNRIFRRHAKLMRTFGGDTELFRYALISALDELAAVMQHDYALDEQLAAVERVLEAHDSALFADVASGRTPLATAIAALPVIGDLPALAAPAPRMLVDRGTGEIIDAGWNDADEDDEPEAEAPAADNNPFDDPPPAKPAPPPATAPAKTADAATLARLTEAATAVYGDRWNADKERQVAESASKGAVQTLAGLTPREAEELAKILVSRLAAMQSQPTEPTQEEA